MTTLRKTIGPSLTGSLSANVVGQVVTLTWPAATDVVGTATYTVTRSPAFSSAVTTTATNYQETYSGTGNPVYSVTVTDSRGLTSSPALSSGVVIVQPPAGLLFTSGFEPNVTLPTGYTINFGNSGNRDLSGTDVVTGYTWPPAGYTATVQSIFPSVGGGGGETVELFTTTGRTGASTKVLRLRTPVAGNGANNYAQNALVLGPTGTVTQLYMRWWMFLPADWFTLTASSGGLREVAAIKTNGDYRWGISVLRNGGQPPYWYLQEDNVANGGLPEQIYFTTNRFAFRGEVPENSWFKIEQFIKRSSGTDGRWWLNINGTTMVDRSGANIGTLGAQINRIFPNLAYGDPGPVETQIDDLELWSDFPSDASAH